MPDLATVAAPHHGASRHRADPVELLLANLDPAFPVDPAVRRGNLLRLVPLAQQRAATMQAELSHYPADSRFRNHPVVMDYAARCEAATIATHPWLSWTAVMITLFFVPTFA
jgi:hypothetical protein